MNDNNNPMPTRRNFIAGVAGAVGAALVSGKPQEAMAQNSLGGLVASKPIADGRLFFVDGSQLRDATKLASGDTNLGYVHVRVIVNGSFAKGSRLDALTGQTATFNVWTNSPSVGRELGFHATTGPSSPLRMATESGLVTMVVDAKKGAKLLPGHYVLFPSPQHPEAFVFDQTADKRPLLQDNGMPATVPYLWLTVSQA